MSMSFSSANKKGNEIITWCDPKVPEIRILRANGYEHIEIALGVHVRVPLVAAFSDTSYIQHLT
jgi:hypothetical protein